MRKFPAKLIRSIRDTLNLRKPRIQVLYPTFDVSAKGAIIQIPCAA